MVGGGCRVLLCAQRLYYRRDLELDCPPLNGLNHYLSLNKTGAHSTSERFRATMALFFPNSFSIQFSNSKIYCQFSQELKDQQWLNLATQVYLWRFHVYQIRLKWRERKKKTYSRETAAAFYH